MRFLLCVLCAFALSGLATIARADPPTFRITQIYSNIDGSLQFVELTEFAGLDGQHRLTGLKLTATSGDVAREYTFDHDLRTDRTAHTSFVVAVRSFRGLPVGDRTGSYFCCWGAAYWIDSRFLPTERGTLDFAGVDRVSYAGLPSDGASAIDRDGQRVPATLPKGPDCLLGVACDSTRVPLADEWHYTRAVEYYNAGLDHWFVTASAADMDGIESARLAGWQRTGTSFIIGGGSRSYPGMDTKVCRYRLPPSAGNSHFLSGFAEECASVAQRYPDAVLETTAAFHVALPDPATGACPVDGDWNNAPGTLAPVYRLWNGRAESNHRYVLDPAVRASMMGRGYVSEGYGPDGVAFCVR